MKKKVEICKKSQRRNYSKGKDAQNMKSALQELRDSSNPNISNVAETYQISRRSLSERFLGNLEVHASPGKKSYLSLEEEEYLVNWLIEMAAIGLGFDIKTMKKLIRNLLGKDTTSVTNGWVQYFLQKHPELSLRKSEAFDRLRMRSLDEDVISYYFVVLQIAFYKCEEMSRGVELTPNRIFAMDETGIQASQKGGYVLTKRGTKSVISITSESREHLTIVAHACALGLSGSPMFITPRKIEGFLENHFVGSKAVHSSSGYINDNLFTEWCHHFVDDIQRIRGDSELWCLLILDSHQCHTMVPEALRILNEAKY